jgi:hypothetical protein
MPIECPDGEHSQKSCYEGLLKQLESLASLYPRRIVAHGVRWLQTPRWREVEMSSQLRSKYVCVGA